MSTTTINLADYIERKRVEGSIPLELSDGTVIVIPPIELWPDGIESLSKVGATTAILGADDWALFSADGGTAELFIKIIAESQGATVGEFSASAAS